MSDPFSDKHSRDEKATDKAAKDAAKKQLTGAVTARLTVAKKHAERPPNWDIGYPFPKKFYDPTR